MRFLCLRRELLHVLAAIHFSGVVHGDLAARNVVKRQKDGKVYIIDFSHSKLHDCPGEGCFELAQAKLELLES